LRVDGRAPRPSTIVAPGHAQDIHQVLPGCRIGGHDCDPARGIDHTDTVICYLRTARRDRQDGKGPSSTANTR